MELETEKNTFMFQIGENQKIHNRDQIHMNMQLEEMQTKYSEIANRQSRMEKVEEAIILLYLEMRDRSTEVVRPNDEQVRKDEEEKEKKKLRKEDPLVVIDKLKATLRTLLAFKEDFEEELKDQARRRKNATEEKLAELHKKLETIENEKDGFKDAATKAIAMRDEAMNTKREIIEESNHTILAMKRDINTMKDLLEKKESEISSLHMHLNERDVALRHREIQLMRVEQLKREIQKNQLKHQFELNKFRSAQKKCEHEIENQRKYQDKIDQERIENEQKLKQMGIQLSSYKVNANRQQVEELESENIRLENLVRKLTEELDETKRSFNRLDNKVTILQKENAEMKKKYQDIFEAHMKEKEKKQREELQKIKEEVQDELQKNIESNPHVANFYRKKYKEKEKEVGELTKRVRRMILIEHKTNIQEKNYELERSRLQLEVASLKKALATQASPSPTKGAIVEGIDLSGMPEVNLKQKNQELEEKLRDFENLKSASQTQAKLLKQHNLSIDIDDSE